MVYTKQTRVYIMDTTQDNWRELVEMPKDKKLDNSTKQRLLAEYEVKTGKNGGKRQLSRIPLWYFLHEILNVKHCHDMIRWEDAHRLVFSIKKPKELAALWGAVKNKNKGTMTYAKLARGIRYYYGKGVIEKFRGKRFCYQFILSKKTKSVLSKYPNLDVKEINIVNEKLNNTDNTKNIKKSEKRKLSVTVKEDSSQQIFKRRRSSLSTASSIDSNDTPELSSDEEESEFKFTAEWNVLDNFITDIFNDQLRMKEIFNDLQCLETDNNIHNVTGIKQEEVEEPVQQQQTNDEIPSDLLNFCDDISELIKQENPEDLTESSSSTSSSLLQDNKNLLINSHIESKPITKQPLSRKRSKSETTSITKTTNPYLFSSSVISTPSTPTFSSTPSSVNTAANAHFMYDMPNFSQNNLQISRSLPDFSFLQTLLEYDDSATTDVYYDLTTRKEYLLEPLDFEKSFMENIL